MANNPRDHVVRLTPPGAGALAVVRVAGPGVRPFLADHFSKSVVEGRCVHGELRDDAGVIDDPVVVLGTGGAFADVTLHGGPWVIRRTLELAARYGFAESPEASTIDARDAVECDVATAIPSARTELALRVLLAQPAAWARLRERLDSHALQRAAADVALANLLRLPRVAIVGAANVGKSTVANQLFGTNRSITADLPGTTRDWVGEVADVNGVAVMLIDTPGVRKTDDAIERRAIELAGAETRAADLVVLVLDASRPLEPEQAELIRRFTGALVVLNKADRPCPCRPAVHADVETVATDGRGVDALRRSIAARFGCDALDISAARCWTDRQREIARHPELLYKMWDY